MSDKDDSGWHDGKLLLCGMTFGYISQYENQFFGFFPPLWIEGGPFKSKKKAMEWVSSKAVGLATKAREIEEAYATNERCFRLENEVNRLKGKVTDLSDANESLRIRVKELKKKLERYEDV